jgi:hypothetical protein
MTHDYLGPAFLPLHRTPHHNDGTSGSRWPAPKRGSRYPIRKMPINHLQVKEKKRLNHEPEVAPGGLLSFYSVHDSDEARSIWLWPGAQIQDILPE